MKTQEELDQEIVTNNIAMNRAAQESGLAAEYAGDPGLLKFYMRNLLIKGWAGIYTDTDRRYMQLARQYMGRPAYRSPRRVAT